MRSPLPKSEMTALRNVVYGKTSIAIKAKQARVLMTSADEDEAKDFINREVEDMQWRAANRD